MLKWVNPSIRLRALLLGAAALVSGCAMTEGTGTDAYSATPATLKTFSGQLPGPGLPPGWSPLEFGSLKKATSYDLVSQDGRTVLRASADASASGLIQRVRFDPHQFPLLSWSWKVPALIAGADNTVGVREDSPVRIIVAFQGDVATLPVMERVTFKQFQMLTRRELPFATLMYIWENHAPRNTVITSAHTSRIKMIVAESGASRLGSWQQITRNLYDDYKMAFGDEPPQVKWIGIMTDTDNTGESASAFYGDIKLERAAATR